ncbi:hypothetical protein CEQ21_02025 [Niallia circulans]|uniref:Uncharacterized protein n=1 Tax=Niallia circulans TaxID=1397 RepID=A0A553SRX5_NIACI|nr:hypothetical protein CEQ21_02025 [Niallia circulans]
MATTRHKVFNLILIIIPWIAALFIGKSSFKRYSLASVLIAIFETLNHLYAHKRRWWKFYDKKTAFIRDEFPFDIGPYIPMSLYFLKYSYGNFKKFILINLVANVLFAFGLMPLLKFLKIVKLTRINYFQFFIYIHYKAYLLYGAQYLIERRKRN